MHCTKKITDSLTWVGADDRRLSMFEGIYSVKDGVSYNSFLLKDEKTVLFDTVDKAVEKVFLENIEYALGGRKLDYVVVHHMEPDHSATLRELLLRYPEAVVVCGALAAKMLGQFFPGAVFNIKTVAEGDTLSVGSHELSFVAAPMVHWPEVIMTYEKTEKMLFSADAFGSFGALNGAIFADEVDFFRDVLDEARRYYTNIVGKYGPQVQAVLEKLAGIEVKYLCPLHGYVWRTDFSAYLEKYALWSSYTPEENGVMLAYASVYGNTENAANILACRLREGGMRVQLFDVSVTPASDILSAAFRFGTLVFASTTYNAGIFVSMEELLRDLASHNLQNRTVAFIQNGSWAPQSGLLMRAILEKCKNMTFLDAGLTLKSALGPEQSGDMDALAAALISATKPAPAPLDSDFARRLTYGLFVVTTRDGEKDNGCIVNTVQQLTANPDRITVAVNKQNYTNELIKKTGVFNVSVLSEDAPFALFKRFGFASGRDTNKFSDLPSPRAQNGIVYLDSHANCVLCARVTDSYDYGTHTLFVAELTETRVLSAAPSASYAYYFAHIKPKLPAPKALTSDKVWVCRICGYVYDEAKEGVPFEQLPDDWTCPWCKHPKSDFELKAPEAPKDAPAAKVWVCKICGYVYDEAKEGVPFEQLPDDWTCPWCKHPKSDFEQR